MHRLLILLRDSLKLTLFNCWFCSGWLGSNRPLKLGFRNRACWSSTHMGASRPLAGPLLVQLARPAVDKVQNSRVHKRPKQNMLFSLKRKKRTKAVVTEAASSRNIFVHT